jgi:hypothetical protein
MTASLTAEDIARIIAPDKWRVLDSQFQHVLHSHRSYEIERFKDKESLAKAAEILARLSPESVGEGGN